MERQMAGGEEDCERLGFYSNRDPDFPDLNRLFTDCVWDADTGRWEPKQMAQSLHICGEIVGLQNPRQTPHSAITQKWPPMRFPVRVTPLGGGETLAADGVVMRTRSLPEVQ
jgi:hypothetical protein